MILVGMANLVSFELFTEFYVFVSRDGHWSFWNLGFGVCVEIPLGCDLGPVLEFSFTAIYGKVLYIMQGYMSYFSPESS